jgi:hypothetical protein
MLIRPKGLVDIWDVDEKSGLWRLLFRQKNQIQYEWAAIACQLFGFGKVEYKINAVYIEYENVAAGADPVSIPSFDRTEGREYFSGLSGPRDYLRVPLLSSPQLAVADGYSDYFTGTGTDFNQLTFLAQTTGTSGSRGTAFGDSVNSKVAGLALVSTPDWSDATKDLIFGRAYFAQSKQVLKQSAHQIGVSWKQIFV